MRRDAISLEAVIIQALPFLILLTGLLATVLTDNYIDRLHKRILTAVILLTVALIIQNAAEVMLNNTPFVLTRKLLGIYGYSVRPAIIVLFYYYAGGGKWTAPAWCLASLNAALYMTALFSPLTFSFGEPYYAFKRGPLGYAAPR